MHDPETADPKNFATVADAAERTGFTVRQIRNFLATKRIRKYVRAADLGKILVDVRELESLAKVQPA